MEPLLILVGIPKAWKKEVWVGSRPVGPAGIETLLGARAPTRAGASTCIFLTKKISIFLVEKFETYTIGEENVSDNAQVVVGEHKTDVKAAEGSKRMELGVARGLCVGIDDETDKSVLSHDNQCLSTESTTNLMHLVRADVVSLHDQHLGVVVADGLQLLLKVSLALRVHTTSLIRLISHF